MDEHRREGEIGQSREAGNLASAVSRHDRVPGVKTGAMECEDDDSGGLRGAIKPRCAGNGRDGTCLNALRW